MIKVKCNFCENVYEIPDDTSGDMSWAYDMTYCDKCGYNSYEILPEEKGYIKSLIQDKKKHNLALDNNYDQRLEDMRHTMSLLKEELNELIQTYIDPFLK